MPVDLNQPLPLREVDDETCPHCGTSLLGAPIPSESRHYYAPGTTHFRREIGVEVEDYDGVMYWVCPDCHHAWPRFTGKGARAESSSLAEMSRAVVILHEEQRDRLADTAIVEALIEDKADQIEFAAAMAGLRWTGWAPDPRTGAVLYMVVEVDAEARLSGNLIDTMEQARSLIGDITGLPIAIVLPDSPACAWLANTLRPVPRNAVSA